MSTVRVRSTHPESQGPFVILEERDFDPAVHVPYAPEEEAASEVASPPLEPESSTPRPRARRKG